jgi:hypothetical protein
MYRHVKMNSTYAERMITRISASSMTGGPICAREDGTELAHPGITMPGMHSAFIDHLSRIGASSLDVSTSM